MREMDLLNNIRLELSKRNITTFRINVAGLYTKDRRYIPPSVPKGFSDLVAILQGGLIAFLEVKVKPNKPTKEQLEFLSQMREKGCIAGVVYSVEEAVQLCS